MSAACPRCGTVPNDWDQRNRDPGLRVALQAAVPLWMAQLEAMDEVEAERHIWWWTQTAVAKIAFQGDVVQYGGGKRGQVADVFNHLASALAALAFSPGGVLFAGLHWCARREQLGES